MLSAVFLAASLMHGQTPPPPADATPPAGGEELVSPSDDNPPPTPASARAAPTTREAPRKPGLGVSLGLGALTGLVVLLGAGVMAVLIPQLVGFGSIIITTNFLGPPNPSTVWTSIWPFMLVGIAGTGVMAALVGLMAAFAAAAPFGVVLFKRILGGSEPAPAVLLTRVVVPVLVAGGVGFAAVVALGAAGVALLVAGARLDIRNPGVRSESLRLSNPTHLTRMGLDIANATTGATWRLLPVFVASSLALVAGLGTVWADQTMPAAAHE